MDREAEFALFTRLAREPKLREWLTGKLEAELAVLVVAEDVRKAQGRAQLLKQIIDLLDAAKAKL
jgi:hypothetical protein